MTVPLKFEDLDILQLLMRDERPTFVLEKDAEESWNRDGSNVRLVFENAALKDFLENSSCPNICQFTAWALKLYAEPGSDNRWHCHGRIWKGTIVRVRWLVVYCSQESICPSYWRGAGRHSDNTTHDSALAPVRPPVFSALSDDGPGPQLLDWTRHPVGDVSEHIQFMKDFDWGSTSVGLICAWPQALRQLVVCMLSNPDPRLIFWGEDLTMIYNEAAVPRMGELHPHAMGRPVSQSFSHKWPRFASLLRPAVFEGRASRVDREIAFLNRNGILEECYFSYTIAPVTGPDGYALGAIDSFTELTTSVIQQRRRDIIAFLAQDLAGSVRTLQELWPRFLQCLSNFKEEVPYAAIYAADALDSSTSSGSMSHHTKHYTLEATLGVKESETFPPSFELNERRAWEPCIVRVCREAQEQGNAIALQQDDNTLPEELAIAVPDRGWGDTVRTVCILPVAPTPSGALAYLIMSLNPRRPFNDETFRFAQYVRDMCSKPAFRISQQKFEEINDQLSEQLKISTLEAARIERRFTRLAESSPIGICTFGADGRVAYVNDKYLELIGVERDFDQDQQACVNGRGHWRSEVDPDQFPDIDEAWKNLRNGKTTSVSIEYRLKRPWRSSDKATGSELVGETWMLNKATVEHDDQGNIVYIHAWLLDVSSQHYTASLLAQRLEEALDNKRKSENFIDMVSHELRNPLSAILQSADGILTHLEEYARELTTKPSERFHDIEESTQTITLCAQHQKCIVDDILTLSKLDSNLLVITPDKVQPPSLVSKTLKMYEAELLRAKVEAVMEVDSSYTQILQQRDYVMLDPSRVLQVVINLLSNAIKFTQYAKGQRKITISLGASFEEPVGATNNPAIFAPRMSRHEHPIPLSADWGNGKALYIRFTVRDTGRGLGEEEMCLLFKRFSQTSPKTYKQYGGSGLGLFISRELTELQGGRIGVSSPGVGKGSTFAFYVRARLYETQANGNTSESPVGLEHVWKPPITTRVAGQSPTPARPEPLSLAPTEKPRLSRVPTNSRSTPTSPRPDSPKEQMHVLVVEDNLVNQKVMAQQLRRSGFIVHVANHGVEALSFLQQSQLWAPPSPTDKLPAPPTPTPPKIPYPTPSPPLSPTAEHPPRTPLHIVLMDVEMPTMDGLTCVREIRRLQAVGQIVRHVPCIAVTANARGEQISVAMRAGMDDVVTKPFRIPELVPAMEHLMEKFRAEGVV